MDFQCQTESIENLKHLAEHNQHGVIITGLPGSGKTYLARQYSKYVKIPDFYKINPAVGDLKTTIDGCVTNGTPVVLCIENLDEGVAQAAYPLLKIIEDCPGFMYIVVTCNNLYGIPDTILSRCALVTVNPPTRSDIDQYAKSKDLAAFDFISKNPVWACTKSMSDADIVLKFTPDHLKYFSDLQLCLRGTDSVSAISWRLQHFDDNSETPIVIIVRYLMNMVQGYHKKACIECLNDLADNRISKNAIISKLVFELKYVR